jgi:hypothetical protein
MPGDNNANWLRAVLVSEVTESFMHRQNKGWGFLPAPGYSDNENSCGEALSLFLTQQLAVRQGFPLPYTGFTANTSNGWLNSSRDDYVNSTLPYAGNGPGTGGSMLFLYYLFHQLGFSIEDIIANAPGYTNGQLNSAGTLRGVYANLTGDSSDPFPFFKQLLDIAYPEGKLASIPGPNPDDPWPLASFEYCSVKNTFGKDEVNDVISTSGGIWPMAFELTLNGFNRRVLASTTPAIPAISFGGVACRPSAPPESVVYQFTDPRIPQLVRFRYDLHFDPPPALGAFPDSGETAVPGNASISVLGRAFAAQTEFFFTAGADPYFMNVKHHPVDPAKDNPAWLSEDLRVFTAVPGLGSVPVPAPSYVAPPGIPAPGGAPKFLENRGFGDYDIAGAYAYITNLVSYLNQHYGSPSGVDPFDTNNSLLPGQLDAYTGDSSVTPGTIRKLASGQLRAFNNYNFAIARVRLRGTAGSAGAAEGVKVFFRLWQTQSADTDWNPGYTYLSDDPTGMNPTYPMAPTDNHTSPFFAVGNYPQLSDPANQQSITIEQGDSQWAYFGCFLNLYDSGFMVNGQSVQQDFAQGTHHCLVAQIAYQDTPIQNVGRTTATADDSDKLAQRNLVLTASDNPGSIATHRIPQTFDIRRTDPTPMESGASVPDELMILWGNTPAGSTAEIYWPGADAAEILSIAGRLYGSQALSAADAHTIRCSTVEGATYVPIPPGTGENLAGLLSIDRPATVVKGQEFNVVIRRIGTRSVSAAAEPVPPAQPRIAGEPTVQERVAAAAGDAALPSRRTRPASTERYIVGSFQIRIPVRTKTDMLPAEETTLAILKARRVVMPSSSRWYPVLDRYLQLVSARVDGLGGRAASVLPNFLGNMSASGSSPDDDDRENDGAAHRREKTGRVARLLFDRLGDFEGFILETVHGVHRYPSREKEIMSLIERAWSQRWRITVISEHDSLGNLVQLIVR